MNNISIEPIKEIEVETLQKIGKRTFKETFSVDGLEEDMEKYLHENFNVAQLSQELSNPESQFYFTKMAEEVIGYLKVNKGNAQTEQLLSNALEIERIYVDSPYFGKGLGQILLDKAIDIAINEKCERVWLGVWEDNIRAIKFYSKHGFIEFDKHVFVLGDDKQIDILMKMEL